MEIENFCLLVLVYLNLLVIYHKCCNLFGCATRLVKKFSVSSMQPSSYGCTLEGVKPEFIGTLGL